MIGSPIPSGAVPRPANYPLILNRTRELTASKCNIWKACVNEATLSAQFNHEWMCLITERIEINFWRSATLY